MKRFMKMALILLLLMSMVLSVTGCARREDQSGAARASLTAIEAQGVTDSEILIGSVFFNSGQWAFIGVPVVDAVQAVFDRINAQGGIRGRQIRFIHYDCQNDMALARTFIERLVEEDRVFALTMLCGPMVNPSLDYLREIGIPVVNISSGLNEIYREYAPRGAVFPIQPSSGTDGRFLLARVLHESIFGPNKNQRLPSDAMIGVFYTTIETSLDSLEGLMYQAELEGVTNRIIAEAVTPDTYPTMIQRMRNQGVQILIALSNDSRGITAAMDDANWLVPFIGQYGTSTAQSHSVETYHPGRPIYATVWAEYVSPEALDRLADLDDALTYNRRLTAATRESYKNNAFARAGFAAGITMAYGLRRLDESDLPFTWESFVTVMEAEPFELGAYGYFNYADGVRMGITNLAFTEFTAPPGLREGIMLTTFPFETLEEIMAKSR